MTTTHHRSTAFIAALVACSTSCDKVDWPGPEYIDSLRVLGVKAEPPTLTEGGSTELSMRCVDGSSGAGRDPTCNAEVAWFSDCDNPDENDPNQCLGRYARWAERMGSPLSDLSTQAYPRGFGFGPTFRFTAPPNILVGTLESEGRTIRYGTSYIYFAVCRGQLVPIKGAREQLPVACRDRRTGKTLDHRSFVVGVKTLYTYDTITSRNPILLAPRLDGSPIQERCASATDCPSQDECAPENGCAPVVAPCLQEKSDGCRWHCLDFSLDSDSFRVFTTDGVGLDAPLKSLWMSSFTNAGRFSDDDEYETSFGLHSPTAPRASMRTPCLRWQAPHDPTDDAHVWAVVRDNRGGLTVWDQRIEVR